MMEDIPIEHQSFDFETEHESDVTIHYQNASYHMHRFVLVNTSEYFKAVLSPQSLNAHQCDGDNKCSELDSSKHMCLTIKGDKPGQLGGVDVSVDLLNGFFRHLYSQYDGTGVWKEKVKADRVPGPDGFPIYYFCAEILSRNVEKDEITYISHEYDGSHREISRGVKFDDGEPVSTSEGSFVYSTELEESPHFWLSMYFGCQWLMQRYEANVNFILDHFTSNVTGTILAWRLLRLCFRRGWTRTRDRCLGICAGAALTPDWEDMGKWKHLTASFSSEEWQLVTQAIRKEWLSGGAVSD